MENFWSGKRVLITGHTGFKGSWLSLYLQLLGANVIGFALAPPTQPNLFALAEVAEGMCSFLGDIRDAATVNELLQSSQPEIVIHMAAQALVRDSYQHPVQTYETNVMGLVNVLEAIRQTKSVRAVVNVTSDKCYDNKEWLWGYRENEALGGHDPYSSSKACAELVTQAYRKSFFHEANGPALASARAGNVIGGGDWAKDRLIPDILRAFQKGEAVKIRHPQSIRPWQHVLEPLSGYLLLAQKLYEEGAAFAEGWNFGPEDHDAKPVSWIVERLIENWKGKAAWVLDEQPQWHEAHYLKLDCSKAKARLGWHPRWTLEKSLEMIVEWQQHWQQGGSLREFTLQQIVSYQDADSECCLV